MREHIRTCRGCNQKSGRETLLRYVLSHDKTTIIYDEYKKMSGRGMWVHKDPQCMKRASKLGTINHAFKTKIDKVNSIVLSEFTRCDS
ncbi:YlxR family protein [Actinomyces sp. zg-332]|uniref:YlxR family protein n=1 Tax=Actinomyces sp. zg-332 TaxID=2708340 RepID=UPI00141E69DC|nr:YlxR family protein [Actinomyces sp. zg-332]QPK93934.1 YlxR family protein [Actinomyces sp. zg-332]